MLNLVLRTMTTWCCLVLIVATFLLIDQVKQVEGSRKKHRHDDECDSNKDCLQNYKYLNAGKIYCCKESAHHSLKDRVCGSNCIGQECDEDNDCAKDECCNSSDYCALCGADAHAAVEGLAGWIVAVIVISAVVLTAVSGAIVISCCFCGAVSRRRAQSVGVAFTQTTATQQQPGTAHGDTMPTATAFVITPKEMEAQQYPHHFPEGPPPYKYSPPPPHDMDPPPPYNPDK